MKTQMKTREPVSTSRPAGIRILQCLLYGYLLTGILLLILAGIMYKAGLGEKTVAIGIMVIYVVSSLVAGICAGKKADSRKYLWGLLQGGLYFLVLLLVTLLVTHQISDLGSSVITTFLMCTCSGMLGGMLA